MLKPFFIATLTCCLAIAAPPPGNSSDTAAQVVFRDYLGPENPADRIRSGGPGNPYAAYFVANGNVALDLRKTDHLVYLDFGTTNPTAAGLTGLHAVYLTNGVYNTDGTCCSSTGLLGMNPGDPPRKSWLAIDFTDSQGQSWTLRFAKFNDAQTGDLTVTRIDGGTWTLEAPPESVAVLILKGKKSQTITGYFAMPTKLTVTKQ